MQPVREINAGQCVLTTSSKCNNEQLLLLPCLHSVCKPCVDKHKHKHKHKTVRCRCGQEMKLDKKKLPCDYVSKNKSMLSGNHFECGYLTEPCREKVESYCCDCNLYLSHECQEHHGKTRANATHKVIAIEDIADNPPWKHLSYTTCSDHPGQQLFFVDKDCKKSICNICFTRKHAGHEVKALDTEHEDRKNEVTETLQKYEARFEEFKECLINTRKRVPSLQKKHEKMEKEITSAFEKIAAKYLQWLKEFQEESGRIQGKVLEDIKYLSDGVVTLKTTTNYANASLNFTSQAELLDLADVLVKRMEEDLALFLPDKTKVKNIVFSHSGQKALEQIAEMFGDDTCTQTCDVEKEEDTPRNDDAQMKWLEAEDEIKRLQSSISTLEKEQNETKKKWKQTEAALKRRIHEGKQSVKLLQSSLTNIGLSLVESPHLLESAAVNKSLILQCLPIEYDLEKLFKRRHVNKKGELVNTKDPSKPCGNTIGRFQNYKGTTSTAPILQCDTLQYIEVLTNVSLTGPRGDNNLILNIGVCRETDRDLKHSVPIRQYCYSLQMVECSKHNALCTIFSENEKVVHHLSENLPHTVGSHTIHYGIVFNTTKKRMVFLEVQKMNVIGVVDDVDYTQAMWPMFGVYSGYKAKVSMKLVVGNDIDMTPKKKSLILKAL